MEFSQISAAAEAIALQLDHVIVGKQEVTRQAVVVMLCGGHLLIEDVPGVGKTTLAKGMARAIGGEYRRIQFTPDLLPSDVTGTSILNQQNHTFEFQPGPIFGNVILADEINRATPKTQSALLEAMEEHQVTTDGVERHLPQPFFVLATQNNIEMMGTFPLPEAQLDRFFGRISIGYPGRDAEIEMIFAQEKSHPIDSVKAVISPIELLEIQKKVREVFVDPKTAEYIVEIVRATRDHSLAQLGASPRGSINLMLASKAKAAMAGREFITPDDVKGSAEMVLSHRLMTRGEARTAGSGAPAIIRSILERVPAPIASR